MIPYAEGLCKDKNECVCSAGFGEREKDACRVERMYM